MADVCDGCDAIMGFDYGDVLLNIEYGGD